MTYENETCGIHISVTPQFLADHSSPAERHYVWAYHVVISNQARTSVQLLSRYWHITDALGRVQEVNGPGVVGEQPVIAPGDSYSYTSGCPLPTSSGVMRGHYVMLTATGDQIKAVIPAFSLDSPDTPRILN